MDTSTRRGLVDSAYNERRSQCEKRLQQFEISALRDISLDEFNGRKVELSEIVMKRRGMLSPENERVLEAVHVMKRREHQ